MQAIQGLEHLSPLKILARGYAVVESQETIIYSVNDVDKGDSIDIQLTDGKVKATVEDTLEERRN